MKKIIAVVLAGAAITTAALAFAGRQAAKADDCATMPDCGSCPVRCCADNSDT